MPNHILNQLTIIGTPEQVSAVRDSLRGPAYEDGEERTVDFNRLMPMPQILREIGEVSSELTTAAEKLCRVPLSSNTLIAMLERSNRQTAPVLFDDPEKQAKLEKIIQAHAETGHLYWYDWSIANWGTKWNAYGFPSVEAYPATILRFETAWSAVPALIEMLVAAHPNIDFLYEWADEDTGYNTGAIRYEGGLKWVCQLDNGSQQAYEMAFKLRPHYKQDYELVDGQYKYVDQD